MSTLERTPVQTRGTKPFLPDLVFFEPDALNYPKGQRIMDWVKAKDIPYRMTTSHNRITNLPGETEVEKYRMAKNFGCRYP